MIHVCGDTVLYTQTLDKWSEWQCYYKECPMLKYDVGSLTFDNEDNKLYQYYYQFKCNDWFLSDCLLPCRTDCDRWTKATNWAIFGYIVIPQSDNVVTDHVNCTNEGKDALTPD